MKISIENLTSTNFDIKKIFAMNQRWGNNAQFQMNQPRPTDALMYFCDCDAEFAPKDGSEPIYIKKGSLFFIPHGAAYTWTFYNGHNGKDVACQLFEFLLIDESDEIIELSDRPQVVESGRAGIAAHLFASLLGETSRPQRSLPAVKSVAFSIIATFSRLMSESSISRKSFGCIYSGIKYLEEDPTQEKSVDEIAKMCNVSVNYFERLFKEYSGMTPTKYRLVRRTERARLLLETPSLSIEQIAAELNFSDCAYFCRCFKKIVGMTPSEYRKAHSGALTK